MDRETTEADSGIVENSQGSGDQCRAAEYWYRHLSASDLDVTTGEAAEHRRSVGGIGLVVEGQNKDAAADAPLQIGCRACGNNPASVQNDDLVGEMVSLFEVLGGEQNGGSVFDELFSDVP